MDAYTVTVERTRTVREQLTVAIRAEDEPQARKLAMEIAEAPGQDRLWEITHKEPEEDYWIVRSKKVSA